VSAANDDAQIIDSASVAQTEAIAADLASRLRGGECIALHGDLGAGKTQFVRGLVRALGGDPRRVSSPTFVLLNVYDNEPPRLTVYHLDAYRVHGAQDFEAIGFAELLEQPGGVVVVEWAERIAELLPEKHIEVRIQSLGKRRRRIEVRR
jgi:tRNA threonylcarbamoyladenosine biosynthesis protein TsaE